MVQQLRNFWEEDEGDYHANIGKGDDRIDRAITLVLYSDGYGISPRSYFPFKKKQYGKRFDNIYDASIYSVDCIKNWVQSIFTMEQEQFTELEQPDENNLLN